MTATTAAAARGGGKDGEEKEKEEEAGFRLGGTAGAFAFEAEMNRHLLGSSPQHHVRFRRGRADGPRTMMLLAREAERACRVVRCEDLLDTRRCLMRLFQPPPEVCDRAFRFLNVARSLHGVSPCARTREGGRKRGRNFTRFAGGREGEGGTLRVLRCSMVDCRLDLHSDVLRRSNASGVTCTKNDTCSTSCDGVRVKSCVKH